MRSPVTGRPRHFITPMSTRRARDNRGQHIQIEVSTEPDSGSGSPEVKIPVSHGDYSLTPDMTLFLSTTTPPTHSTGTAIETSSGTVRDHPRPCDIIVHSSQGGHKILTARKIQETRDAERKVMSVGDRLETGDRSERVVTPVEKGETSYEISQSHSNESTQPTSPSSSHAYTYGFCTTHSVSV